MIQILSKGDALNLLRLHESADRLVRVLFEVFVTIPDIEDARGLPYSWHVDGSDIVVLWEDWGDGEYTHGSYSFPTDCLYMQDRIEHVALRRVRDARRVKEKRGVA